MGNDRQPMHCPGNLKPLPTEVMNPGGCPKCRYKGCFKCCKGKALAALRVCKHGCADLRQVQDGKLNELPPADMCNKHKALLCRCRSSKKTGQTCRYHFKGADEKIRNNGGRSSSSASPGNDGSDAAARPSAAVLCEEPALPAGPMRKRKGKEVEHQQPLQQKNRHQEIDDEESSRGDEVQMDEGAQGQEEEKEEPPLESATSPAGGDNRSAKGKEPVTPRTSVDGDSSSYDDVPGHTLTAMDIGPQAPPPPSASSFMGDATRARRRTHDGRGTATPAPSTRPTTRQQDAAVATNGPKTPLETPSPTAETTSPQPAASSNQTPTGVPGPAQATSHQSAPASGSHQSAVRPGKLAMALESPILRQAMLRQLPGLPLGRLIGHLTGPEAQSHVELRNELWRRIEEATAEEFGNQYLPEVVKLPHELFPAALRRAPLAFLMSMLQTSASESREFDREISSLVLDGVACQLENAPLAALEAVVAVTGIEPFLDLANLPELVEILDKSAKEKLADLVARNFAQDPDAWK